MGIEAERLKQIADAFWYTEAEVVFGESGLVALHSLVRKVRELYRYIDPPEGAGFLAIVKHIGETSVLCGPIRATPEGIPNDRQAKRLIQLTNEDAFREVEEDDPIDLVALSQNALVYCRDAVDEYMLIGGEAKPIPTLLGSPFAPLCFEKLDEAFRHYYSRLARVSSCEILQLAWADDNRLFFSPGPESKLRSSLRQFLSSHMPGDVSVRPEQIVDESHPVDIRVSWFNSNREAIIEIKWLGDSRDMTGTITASHRDKRARDGADQLVEYLDNGEPFFPHSNTFGYLVIFDGRRRGLTKASETISNQEGFYYQNRNINFDPEHDQSREDFRPPVRMFLEPICT